MDERLPGTKIAERLLTRPEGATMRELIAATGGPQYNVLKKLESKGATVTRTREGRETRYRVVRQRPVYEMRVSDKGQVTLPKGLREEMRVFVGQTLEASVENGKMVVAPKRKSIRDLFGILGKPPSGVHLSLEDIDRAVADAAVARFKRATRR